MKAVILAGGRGTRLYPLTESTPKPLVRVLDVPVIEYAFSALKKLGVTSAALTTCYRPEVFRRVLGDRVHGVDVTYFEERSPLGTAGAVKAAESFLDEDFLVLSGDAVFDFDLSRAAFLHEKRQAMATLLLCERSDVSEYGLVKTDAEGKILAFSEKPSWQGVFSDLVNTGIYLLSPRIFEHIQADVPVDFSKDLFPRLREAGETLYGERQEGYWCDIGSPEALWRCNMDLLRGKGCSSFPFRGRFVGEGEHRSFIGEGARILPGARFESSVIGAGSEVHGANLYHSVLGHACRVQEGAYLSEALCADRVRCGVFSRVLTGAVLSEGVCVGEGACVAPGARLLPEEKVASKPGDPSEYRELFLGGSFSESADTQQLCRDFFRLGQCAASLASQSFLLLWDEHFVSEICKNAFVAGFSPSGKTLLSAPAATLSMARFCTHALGICGGMIASSENGRVRLTLLDRDGLIPVREEIRRWEQAFYRPGEEARGFPAAPVRLGGELSAAYEAYLARILGHLGSVSVTLSCTAGSELLFRVLSRAGAEVSYGAAAKTGGLFLDVDEARLCADVYDDRGLLCDREHLRACLILSESRGRSRIFCRTLLPKSLLEKLRSCGVQVVYPETEYADTEAHRDLRSRAFSDAFLEDEAALVCALLHRWKSLSDVFSREALTEELAALSPFAFSGGEYTFEKEKSARLFSLIWDQAEKTEGALSFPYEQGRSYLYPSLGRVRICSEGVDTESAEELCSITLDTLKRLEDDLTHEDRRN